MPAWPIPIQPNEVDNGEAPRARYGDAPDADPFEHQPGYRDENQRRDGGGEEEAAEPCPRRIRREDDACDLLGDALEVVARRNDRILTRTRVDHGIDDDLGRILDWSLGCH